MNVSVKKAKDALARQKKTYLSLLIVSILGIICGIIFVTVISKGDKTLVEEQLTHFFVSIKNNDINYTSGFFNSIGSNLLYCIGIWLLGISIIGLPLILLFLYMKGFVIGFAISSIISTYGLKGILLSFAYIFPQHILSLMISIVLSFYAVSFSIKLFSYLFLKKNINFKKTMHRYIQILIISLIGFLVVTIIEVYLSPFFIKLFTNI